VARVSFDGTPYQALKNPVFLILSDEPNGASGAPARGPPVGFRKPAAGVYVAGVVTGW